MGPPPEYDIVQICLNGHLINLYYLTKQQFNKKYCPECGESVINICQKCENPIKAPYLKGGIKDDTYSDLVWVRPAFCENCGKPFPRTMKAIKAAREVTAGLDLLSDEQKKGVNKDIGDMVRNTPRALIAAKRFKKILEEKYEQIPSLYHDVLFLALPIVIAMFLGWH